MLSDAQIQSARASLGITPTDASTGTQDRASEMSSLWGNSSSPPEPDTSAVGSGVSQMVSGVKNIKSGTLEALTPPTKPYLNGGIDEALTHLGEGALRTAGGIGEVAMSPVTAVGKVLGPLNPLDVPEHIQKLIGMPTFSETMNDLKSTNPRLADNISNGLNALMTIFGAKGLFEGGAGTPKEAVGNTLDVLKNPAEMGKSALDTVKTAGQSLKGILPQGKPANPEQTAIDAVNPKLSKGKLGKAYSEVATGKREITPSGIITKQGLSEDAQTAQLGARLKDVLTSKDPVENLNSLGKNFDETSGKLETLLQSDKTPVVKQGVTDTLEELKSKMPREFTSIKDNKSLFENVIDFAKEKVNETTPDVKGLRNARIAFDQQAKSEFPSAYKDGYIDIGSPAGRAIRTARDAMNDYAYNTAEQGSEMQRLIQRESDIYKAANNIGPKAAELHGKTSVEQFFKAHPMIGGLVSKLETGGIIGTVLKHGL